MAGGDAWWFHTEGPTQSMAGLAILWFDEPLDWERLREVIRDRLVGRFPRFRQRPVRRGWGFHWEEASDFRIEEHLLRTVLPAPGGRAELEALASRAASTVLDRTKPPWQIQLVEGYGHGCALLVRVHHGIADGMTLTWAVLSVMDEQPSGKAFHPTEEHEGAQTREHLARARRGHLAQWVGRALRIWRLSSEPSSPIRGVLGVEKKVTWSDPMPLTVWHRMAHGTGATVNDVLLAVVAGGLRRYMLARGTRVEDLRATVPVFLRSPREPLPRTLGNLLGQWLVDLPIRERDPLARLREVHRQIDALKRSPEAIVVYDLMTLFGKAGAVARLGVRMLGSRCSLIVSNLHGPRHPVFLAGTQLAGASVSLPPDLRLGLEVIFFSYAGQATLGVSSDAKLIPEPREFLLALHEEMRELAGERPPDLTPSLWEEPGGHPA